MRSQELIQKWLYLGCVMIFIMVMIGGITRLTGSGLSITEWNVIMGTIPPLNEKDWSEAFEKYKNFPQFKLVNQEMNMGEFKEIFFWEYFHRLWGRLIGIAFLIPFIYFLVKKKFKPEMSKKLIVLFALGALQGVIGWFMVKSGLQDRPSVSHYRLATHLIMALILYSYLLYLAFGMTRFSHKFQINTHSKSALKISNIIIVIIFFQLFYGALMAGLKAGLNYPTYPTMNGQWIPDELWALEGFFTNLFSNKATVQFIHRIVPIVLGFSLVALVIHKKKHKKYYYSSTLNKYTAAALIIYAAQFALGIITVINCKGYIPVFWGVAHQMGALVLLTACLIINFRIRKGLSRS